MVEKRLKIAIIIAVALALIIGLLPGYTKLQNLVSENRRLQKMVGELTKSIEDLEKEKKKLESDILYIEKVARDKLGVAREDEFVIKKGLKETR